MARIPTPLEIQYMEEHMSDNKIPSIIAVAVTCAVAAYIAVILRFVSRHLLHAQFKADDWFIVAGLILFTAYSTGFALGTVYGAGRHLILVNNPRSLTLSIVAIECMWCVTIVVVKLSILFLYNRIFPQRWFKRSLKVIGVFIIAWAVSAFFGAIFQCVPLAALWDPTVSGVCIRYGDLSLVIGIFNILTDFIILGLPVPLVWQLKISTQRKWLLTATFMMGGCACIISIVRLFYVQSVGLSDDPSWDDINSGILSGIELFFGILAACIPTYQPLFNRLVHGSANRATINTTVTSSPSRFTYTKAVPHSRTTESLGLSTVTSHGGRKGARNSDDEESLCARLEKPWSSPPFHGSF
ncbi:hypothetical protein MMC19_001271 [Ptychographa xylographoides]|nr:hypothetical protein [Ptychographa xylographoides]